MPSNTTMYETTFGDTINRDQRMGREYTKQEKKELGMLLIILDSIIIALWVILPLITLIYNQ